MGESREPAAAGSKARQMIVDQQGKSASAGRAKCLLTSAPAEGSRPFQSPGPILLACRNAIVRNIGHVPADPPPDHELWLPFPRRGAAGARGLVDRPQARPDAAGG